MKSLKTEKDYYQKQLEYLRKEIDNMKQSENLN